MSAELLGHPVEPLTAAQAQHAALGLLEAAGASAESTRTTHPGAGWFPEAGLGLFVHWGIASVHGDTDLSWSMMANTPWDMAAGGQNKLTPNQYWALADRFNPDQYDPRQWIAAARDAGFRYAVITTMHHDGYTLWPSRWSDFGVQSHRRGRDLVRPFVDACREFGLKVGLYYSPPDWHFDREVMSFHYGSGGIDTMTGTPSGNAERASRAHFDRDHQPTTLAPPSPDHLARRRENFHQRITELLTWYGPIDLLWMDGGTHDNELRDLARALQPHLVINSRSCDADYGSTECALPSAPPDGWLETCHCWQASGIPFATGGFVDVWGYLKEEQYKPTAWMLESLVRLRSWGANFLVNVSPRPNGELPPVVYERLAEIAEWMAHSGASLGAPAPHVYPDRCNVPVTVAGETYYLHALPHFEGPIRLRGITRPVSVTLLRTGEPVLFEYDEPGGLHFALPGLRRTDLVDVVAVRMAMAEAPVD